MFFYPIKSLEHGKWVGDGWYFMIGKTPWRIRHWRIYPWRTSNAN